MVYWVDCRRRDRDPACPGAAGGASPEIVPVDYPSAAGQRIIDLTWLA